jgi:hypothetical protein
MYLQIHRFHPETFDSHNHHEEPDGQEERAPHGFNLRERVVVGKRLPSPIAV